MKNLLFLIIIFLRINSVNAQIFPHIHHTEYEKDVSDTHTLQHFFRNGQFYGHARYFFMSTDNEKDLTDYFSNAFGMGIGYETKSIKGFKFGISGFFIYNILSSDLTKVDPQTGVLSRYELGQFDITNPGNRKDMDRLEDLYLKYSYKKTFLKFGKQHIKTPFINPQDGRMRPTLVEGLMFESNDIKNLKIDGGWLYAVSPRSTVNYFKVAESIGIFPLGINPNGTKSDYAGNLKTNGIYFLGLTKFLKKNNRLQIWNQLIENIQYSGLMQLNFEPQLDNINKLKLISGIQYITQRAINNGGNADQSKTFTQKGAKATAFGLRLGIAKQDEWHLIANYNRITKEGRYLMPREFGRDPFFTFMSRERNEGYGDVHAYNISVNKIYGKSGLQSELTYGRYLLPDVTNTVLNKYGMPSYWQFNADIKYKFKKFLKGMDFQMLYIYKGKVGNVYDNAKFVINKVNMSLYNIVLNYHF